MPHRWSPSGVRRLRRLPTAVRRRVRRGRHRLPGSRPPLLSLVLVDGPDGTWSATSVTQLLSGAADVEVLHVDTGVRYEHPAGRFPAGDPRMRLLRAPGARPGGARNLAVAAARGDFLAFPDPRGVVLDGAWTALVEQLVHSGSDFVTAGVLHGSSAATARPVPPALHAHDLPCVRLDDRPELVADATLANKVFRTSFWRRHELTSDPVAGTDDPAVAVAAYLTARSVDVLARPVQLRPTRLAGIDVSSLPPFVDSLTRSTHLLAGASPRVRDAWWQHLLDRALPDCLEAWLRATSPADGRWAPALDRLLATVPEQTWSQVPFRGRARSWALLHARRELGEALYLWMQREPAGLQTVIEDGRTSFAPPFGYDEQDLPAPLRRVHPVDVRPIARLHAWYWRGDRLVLRGSAQLLPFPDVEPHELRVALTLAGDRFELPVRRYAEPALELESRRSHADVEASGFEVEIDARAVVDRLPPGVHAVGLALTHRQEDFEVRSGITEAPPVFSGDWPGHRVVGGRLVRPSTRVPGGFGVEVRDSWARLVEVRASAVPGQVELVLQTGGSEPAEHVLVGDEEVSARRVDGRRLEVTLDRRDMGRLTVRRSSGAREDVLWALADTGATVEDWHAQADAGGLARVGSAPSVQVTSVEESPAGLLVSGANARPGSRLCLSGPRATGATSLPLPQGGFSVEVPTSWDPWGRGPTGLPADRYRLTCDVRPPAAKGQSAPPLVCAGSALAGSLPQHLARTQTLSATPDLGLSIEVHALPREERAVPNQATLRRDVYPSLRTGARRAAVLFESFRGASAGDSPAALAAELRRRDLGLDLAWTVGDASVEPPPGTRPVLRQSEEWFALLAEAAYLVNNNNFPHFFTKAGGQVYLQTWHGTPLKRIAGDIRDQGSFPLTYLRTMEAEARAWDHLVSPSPYCTEIFRRAFGYAGPVLEVGHPRNDALVGAEATDRGTAVRAQLGLAVSDQVVLYAPTWRDGEGGAGERRLLLDPGLLTRELPEVVLLVRGHANTAAAERLRQATGGRVRDVTLHPDINDLFLASDALVTDYSSVMFDYAVLDRPMLFLVPDLEDYRDRARGFYFDFEREAPGPLHTDTRALVEDLGAGDAGASYAQARAAFRHRFAPMDDGHAAARVVDALFPGTT